MIDRLQQIDERMALAVLLGCHIVICCISLALIAPHHFTFHIFYDPVQLPVAIAAVGAFAVVAWVFTAVPFSFGYLLAFYFYIVVLGYLWLNSYSDLDYDHRLGGLSAAASWIAFAAPALLIRQPIKQRFSIAPATFDRAPDAHPCDRRRNGRGQRACTASRSSRWTISMTSARI